MLANHPEQDIPIGHLQPLYRGGIQTAMGGKHVQ
jgi:hypothetical protein